LTETAQTITQNTPPAVLSQRSGSPSGAMPPRSAEPQLIQINLFDPQNGRGKAKLLNFNGEWLRACTEGQSRPRDGAPPSAHGICDAVWSWMQWVAVAPPAIDLCASGG
jgi:hypothetical protein